MANIYSIPPGEPIAAQAAQLILRAASGDALATALVFVPTRRSAVTLRNAMAQAVGVNAMLLPRIIPLADVADELLAMLGIEALDDILGIPAAMPESERRWFIARQVKAFEEARLGYVSMDQVLALTDSLIAFQDKALRSDIVLSRDVLEPLLRRDVATHWQQTLQFLSIITEIWPQYEQATGMITSAARESRVLALLTHYWQEQPPDYPIFIVGSTASQASTARLMRVVAESSRGHVVLSGLSADIDEAAWQAIAAGHPLYHLKTFLDQWPVFPRMVVPLGNRQKSLWAEVFATPDHMTYWRKKSSAAMDGLKLVSCAHPEEEARVIATLIRETLTRDSQTVGLITPDELLMQRVASHLARDGIVPDRLASGILAETEIGRLWLSAVQVIRQEGAPRAALELLRHPLLAMDDVVVNAIDQAWRGVQRTRAGFLPKLPETYRDHATAFAATKLLRALCDLSAISLSAKAWIASLNVLLQPFVARDATGGEAVTDALEQLEQAEALGAIAIDAFYALLRDRLDQPWRDAGVKANKRVSMLTPVEARLENFDRVILASMSDDLWPGRAEINPWLNQAMQTAIGLPPAEAMTSLIAHDLLVHGSGHDVVLTHSTRKDGSPATRSRFVERLETRLAASGVMIDAIRAPEYSAYANARDAAAAYQPEMPVMPKPPSEQRPRRLPVTDLDRLFRDPFAIYARHVLGLKRLDALEEDPDAADFGSITHRAIHLLSLHWNAHGRTATGDELQAIASQSLRMLEDRPAIDLFWRMRLMTGLHYVNQLEQQRRPSVSAVLSEQNVEAKLAEVELYGRMDRVEQRADGQTVIDYKTGKAPSKNELLDGRALQLLTYAILLGDTAAIEYWQLPRPGAEGEIRTMPLVDGTLDLAALQQKLEVALKMMLDTNVPFIAATGDGFDAEDYAGISRRDEWA